MSNNEKEGVMYVEKLEDVENKINEFITKYLIKPEFKGYKLDRYEYRQCPDRLGYNIFLVITKETR